LAPSPPLTTSFLPAYRIIPTSHINRHRDQSRRSNMSSSTTQFPSSRKIYVSGSRPDVSVPMREIVQSPTPLFLGGEQNSPFRVYDTSGPYTDPHVVIDVHKGLPPLRRTWIIARGDVEECQQQRTLQLGERKYRSRDTLAQETSSNFAHQPLRAKSDRAVTQMSYARRGIITPEMEFIA